MKRLLRMTLQGLVLILPLIVTLYVVYWLANGAENLFAGPLKVVLGLPPTEDDPTPDPGWLGGFMGIHYYRGMGIALGVVLAIVAGLGARILIVNQLVNQSEQYISRIPLIKTLYGAIRDLLGFMGNKRNSFSRVVLVTLPGSKIKVLGLVTRETFDDIMGLKSVKDRVTVCVPQSYLIGGWMLFVPPEELEPVQMTVEDAMRFAMTAGISVSEEEKLPTLGDEGKKSLPHGK